MSLPLPVIVSNFEKYYQKQQLEDQLRERRERLRENRMREEKERLTELGYTGADSSLAELMRREGGVMLFRSPSSLLKIPATSGNTSMARL